MSNQLNTERANYESSKAILLQIDQQNQQFNSRQEEIQFYKNTREDALRDVIYSKMILDFQSLFPIGTSKAKEKYVISWQNSLNFFFFNRVPQLFQYHRLGLIDQDAQFYMAASHEKDILAEVKAYLLMETYLQEQTKSLSFIQIEAPIAWKASVVDLVENIRAWDAKGAIEEKNIDKLAKVFEMVFGVSLKNHRTTFQEIRNRKEPTKFLNQLIEALETKVG